MSIVLNNPEVRQALTEARIAGIVINLPNRVCEIHVQLGYMQNGQWVVQRVQPVQFMDEEFTNLINDVAEFRQLKRALEDYLNTRGLFTGTVS